MNRSSDSAKITFVLLEGVQAFTVDTGGTVLDWHTGYRDAFARAGARHGIERNWSALANDYRRRTMAAMVNLGADGPPTHNFDDAHRFCLDELIGAQDLGVFDADDRRSIAWDAAHGLAAWPDVATGLARLRADRLAVSFTILSYRIIIDTARSNGLTWDAVFSCEGIGIYKVHPDSYRAAAHRLQLEPEQCCMVACHPWDLNAAAEVGFRTAFVRRPREWGPEGTGSTPTSEPGTYDLEVDGFGELADAFAEGE